MSRVLAYVRQSLGKAGETETDSLSLESQAEAIRDWCARHDHALIGVERDHDLGGALDETERPGLARVLHRADAREYDLLVCLKLSRLARSLVLQETILGRLERAGVGYASVVAEESWASNSVLLRQVMAAVSEQQRRDIASHVRVAFRARTKRGLSHGVPPFGYKRGERNGPLVIVPDHAAIVRDLYERFADGAGVTIIANDLTARGVPTANGGPWRQATVAGILDNPAYLGLAHINGETVEGQHAAIVADELWHRVRARRGGRQRVVRRKTVSSWLEGRVVHGCGAPMYLFHGYPDNAIRDHFRCRSMCGDRSVTGGLCPVRPRSIVAVTAEQAVRRCLVRDLAAIVPVADAIADAERRHRDHAPLAERQRRELIDRSKRADQRRTKAEELYLSGARDRAWFDAQDATNHAEAATIATDLAALPEAPNAAGLREMHDRLRSMAPLLADAPDDTMRAVLAECGIAIIGEEGVTVVYGDDVKALIGRNPAS